MGSLLYNYLKDLDQVNDYVFSDHAAMYLSRPDAISNTFNNLLDDLGIINLKVIDGRTRSISSKDIHSFRHTFIFKALTNDPPASIPDVKSMVGNIDDSILKIYYDHSIEKTTRAAINRLDFLN